MLGQCSVNAPVNVDRVGGGVQVEDLLKEALTLKACLDRGTPASMLERLLPKRYKQYQKGISGRA
jgi:hypothetical protein